MGKENNLAKGISEPEKVNDFIKALNHPFKDVAICLRSVILSADKNIGEGIYWNAPTFYFTGKMKPFNVKEYKRFIVGYVFNRKDCLRLVFLGGASRRADRAGSRRPRARRRATRSRSSRCAAP